MPGLPDVMGEAVAMVHYMIHKLKDSRIHFISQVKLVNREPYMLQDPFKGYSEFPHSKFRTVVYS